MTSCVLKHFYCMYFTGAFIKISWNLRSHFMYLYCCIMHFYLRKNYIFIQNFIWVHWMKRSTMILNYFIYRSNEPIGLSKTWGLQYTFGLKWTSFFQFFFKVLKSVHQCLKPLYTQNAVRIGTWNNIFSYKLWEIEHIS